jgi:hypothetical protein
MHRIEASEIPATNACEEAGAYNSVSGVAERGLKRDDSDAAGFRHAGKQRSALSPEIRGENK